MLSAIGLRQTRACFHCRLRAQQLALQARRHRSKSSQPSNSRSSIRPADFGRVVRARPLKYETQRFLELLKRRLNELKQEFEAAPIFAQLVQDAHDEGARKRMFQAAWTDFISRVKEASLEGPKGLSGLWVGDARTALERQGQDGLDIVIRRAFYGQLLSDRFTEAEIENQTKVADLRFPAEWHPGSRTSQRKIHLHVGPTNSGKTYHALKRLEQASSGVYAGPLRLLAHEVYSRLNAKGLGCMLITGEERRLAPEENHQHEHLPNTALGRKLYSCTVEMFPLGVSLDVAVIDEIQMIGNQDRGWAWTAALIGCQAKEIHLCGEARTVPLIKAICASLGEEVEIHQYTRLTGLEMEKASLDGDLSKLRKGDCVVCFSVMGIHAMRTSIEKKTGRKVAIVYGALPPETRAQQARLFNDPDNDYDFLVASDAIGMGLNLAIKRVIFETSSKFDGTANRTLSVADIKQIGGRAGRYRTSFQASQSAKSKEPLAAAKGEPVPGTPGPPPADDDTTGLVTTLEKYDYPIVKAAMSQEPEPMMTAGVFPPYNVLEKFSNYFPPATPFSYMLSRLHELCTVQGIYHLCNLTDVVWLADMIEPVEGLSVADRNTLCFCPANKADKALWRKLLPAYARCVAENKECKLPEVEELPLEVLEEEVSMDKMYLKRLEQLHKGIVAYLWLSYRFAGVFSTRAVAFHAKSLVEDKIEQVLGQMSFSEKQRRQIAARRQRQNLRQLEEILAIDEEESEQENGAETDANATTSEKHENAEEVDDARPKAHLQEQTSIIAGGDQFSGERYEYALEEMADEEDEDAEEAEWAEDDEEAKETEGSERPEKVKKANHDTPLNSPGNSVNSREIDSPSVLDDINDRGERALAATSSDTVSHSTRLQPSADDLPESTVPAKHLAQVDANATEVERELASRP